MDKRGLSAFGATAKKRLIDLNKPQTWLIEQIKVESGLYVDSGLLSRVWRGEYRSKALIASICKILDLDFPEQNSA